MNTKPEKQSMGRHDFREAPGRNLFWALLILFLALGTDYGFRLADLWLQHGQLTQFQTQQREVLEKFPLMQETAKKVQALSIELVQMSPTNAVAEQLVREFGIRWTPPPQEAVAPVAPSAPVPAIQNTQTNK